MSNRIVKLPSVESFGRLTPDKWLALKNLEESAELVEACKQYLKASDPTDPSGIGWEFNDHANCLSKSVYPTAESYGTLAGVLRMLANDVEIMAHEKEMGGRR